MLGKIHPDVVRIDDVFFAAYIAYLGHPVMKCCLSGSSTTLTFLVKEFDLAMMRDEFASLDTSLFVKPYVSAIKAVFEYQKLARQSLEPLTKPLIPTFAERV